MTTIQRLLFKRKRSDAADAWADRALRRGGTFNATTLAALRALDYDLAYFGIKSKLIYFNPRCGDNLISAFTPMIARDGPGFDVLLSGTLAAWSEAAGLLNSASGLVDLGVVVPRVRAINPNSISMGAYILNDTIPVTILKPAVSSSKPSFAINVSGGFQIFDYLTSRVQTTNGLTSDGSLTKGLNCGSIWGSGANDNGVFRNGVLRGSALATNTGGSTPFTSITLNAAGTSGGDFIATGLIPDEVANLFWIMHKFNASLSTPRQVTAEGVS